MKALAAIAAALLLALAGCGGKEKNDKGPGIVGEKPPQPTPGTNGTQVSTPGRTTTSG
jgi:hypothetical protein